MNEAIIATFTFWSAFVFSAGPFWIATMEGATTMGFKQLYYNYIIYLIIAWLPVIIICCFMSQALTLIDDRMTALMFILGGLFILYLAYKVLVSKIKTGQPFNFDYKAMSTVTWLNPKVWFLVPTGFLTAKITDSLVLNTAFYYFSGIPLFLFGVFFWGMLGRFGAQISLKYISYFNMILLAGFGIYLMQKGVLLLT